MAIEKRDKWLETVILHEKSDSTYRAFKTDMKVHILPMYGHLKISQITKSLVSNLFSNGQINFKVETGVDGGGA